VCVNKFLLKKDSSLSRLSSLPPEDLTIKTAGCVLYDIGAAALVGLDVGDGVLVLGGNITSKLAGIGSTLAGLILEHLHSSLSGAGSLGGTSSLLLIDTLLDNPLAVLVGGNKVRSAVVTSNDKPVLIKEHAVHHGKKLHLCDTESGLATLIALSDGDSAVVTNKGKPVARGAEGDTLNPTVAIKLAEGLVERLLLAPCSLNLTAINLPNGAIEDTGLEISRGSGKKLVVRVPCDTSDSAADFVFRGTLDVLADPPIVVLLKVADRHNLGAASHSELVTLRAPLHVGSSTVDTKDNQHGLPLLAVKGPHVSVTILRAGDDTVVDGIPVDASHNTVVLLQNGLSLPASTLLGSDDNIVVVGAEGALGAVFVPGVAGDALTLGD